MYFNMSKPLKYYSKNGTLTEFNKYTIDTLGVVRNAETGLILSSQQDKVGYKGAAVYEDNGKRRNIRMARAIASTFLGPPPTTEHTADHKNRNRDDDTIDNIRWLCKSGQIDNQDRSETFKTAFFVDRYGDNEKTVKEWVDYFNSKDEKNSFGRNYTKSMIKQYAQKKQYGFSYKEYPNLPDEIWKEIIDSGNTKGRWEISNMNRVKYITKYAENVLSGERLGLNGGYPSIIFEGKHWKCHIVSFMTFFPEEWSAKKPTEIVLHEDDDKLDFRPHKLRLGSQSDNRRDAYNNGKYDGTKSARIKCASYIDGVFEKEYESQHDAARYVNSKVYTSESRSNIRNALDPKYTSNFAYGRTWKLI
jgi:hypothetical protein